MQKIYLAKENLSKVKVPEEIYEKVVEITTELKLDGHRGDLTWIKASRALASLEGKEKITKEELKRTGLMVLRH